MSELISVGLGIFSIVVAAAISWGVAKAKINGLADRLDKIENTRYITREEYEARHKELMQVLTALK